MKPSILGVKILHLLIEIPNDDPKWDERVGKNGMGKGYIRVKHTSQSGWEMAWSPNANDFGPLYVLRPKY